MDFQLFSEISRGVQLLKECKNLLVITLKMIKNLLVISFKMIKNLLVITFKMIPALNFCQNLFQHLYSKY